MEALTSILFHGLAYAMILYIVSVGLSVTMGLMGFVNLAHGVFAMAGGYVTVTLMNTYAVPFALALLAAFIVDCTDQRRTRTHALRPPLRRQRTGPGPLHHRPDLHVGRHWCAGSGAPSRNPSISPPYSAASSISASAPSRCIAAFLIVVGFMLIALLWFGIERTNFGAQLRAAVDNRRMAESIGIDTRRLFSLAFALGSGLAALGGGLGADILAIYPGYATEYLVYFLMVVAIGGLGSLRGPFVAALLLGFGDTACKYLVPQLGTFFVFLAMIGLLLWRPAGLFGRA